MKRRKLRIGLLVLGFGLGAAFYFGMRPAWFTQNDLTTGAAPAYPELTSRLYPHPPNDVYETAADTAGRIPRWKVVAREPARREVQVEVRTALFGFTDDLTVRVEPDGELGSRVVVRSRSRVGRGDLGENFRHIVALQKAMDRTLW